MTEDQIKELAARAMLNATCSGEPHYIEDVIREAITQERFYCAAVCDDWAWRDAGDSLRADAARTCARKIRERWL